MHFIKGVLLEWISSSQPFRNYFEKQTMYSLLSWKVTVLFAGVIRWITCPFSPFRAHLGRTSVSLRLNNAVKRLHNLKCKSRVNGGYAQFAGEKSELFHSEKLIIIQ